MGWRNGTGSPLAPLWAVGMGWAWGAPAWAQPAEPQQQAVRLLVGVAVLLLVLFLLILGKAALVLLLGVLLPGLRERGRSVAAARSGSAFWWGLSVSLAWVIAVLFCLILENLGVPALVGGLMALGLCLIAGVATALGFMGVAEHVGIQALKLARREDPSPLAATATGLILLLTVNFVPLFGQLAWLFICAFSVGTFLLTLFASPSTTEE